MAPNSSDICNAKKHKSRTNYLAFMRSKQFYNITWQSGGFRFHLALPQVSSSIYLIGICHLINPQKNQWVHGYILIYMVCLPVCMSVLDCCICTLYIVYWQLFMEEGLPVCLSVFLYVCLVFLYFETCIYCVHIVCIGGCSWKTVCWQLEARW